MKKEPVITYNDILSELERLRNTPKPSVIDKLTSEQKKFLLLARDNSKTVSFTKMAMLWQKAGWGKTNPETLRKYYTKLKDRE